MVTFDQCFVEISIEAGGFGLYLVYCCYILPFHSFILYFHANYAADHFQLGIWISNNCLSSSCMHGGSENDKVE
jgi:hypothetical protein